MLNAMFTVDFSSDVGEAVFTKPRPRPRPRKHWRGRGEAAENQAEARPRQRSQKPLNSWGNTHTQHV